MSRADGIPSRLASLGMRRSAIRFCPPLCVTAEQVDTALDILSRILASEKSEKLAV